VGPAGPRLREASATVEVGGIRSVTRCAERRRSPSASITVKVDGPNHDVVRTCLSTALFTDVITVNYANGHVASPAPW